VADLGVHAALFLAALFFGGLAVFGKIALRSFDPALFVTIRVAGASALLFALAAARRGPLRPPNRRQFSRLALCALLGVVFNQYLFLFGLKRTSAISATIIVTSIPIFTAVFSSLLGVEKLHKRRLAGIGVALLGVLTLIGSSSLHGRQLLGDICIVVNCASYGLFIVLLHPLRAELDSTVTSAWVFGLGLLYMLPFGAVEALRAPWASIPGPDWAALAYCVLFGTLAGYWLNLWALPRSGPTLIALYAYVQPIVASLLAGPLTGEKGSKRQLVSGLLVFAGVYLASTGLPARPKPVLEPDLP
jgi:drug/metabolite transporter (DMT)-like permease